MGESAVFTGLDLVVILIVFFAFFYATSPPGKDDSKFKFEPLTLLVVSIVVGMIAVSLLKR
ncbi:hypothetical protein [Nodosilinea nodulosa]|uniref:hypothetical protein n=1 Tax=Nodosilinea nodulosa TaxID=416001 RepID=UPI0002E10BBC|nr:hypothetical protein [Nodosilinea nodulosa]